MRIGIDFYNISPEYSGGVNTFALGLLRGLLSNIGKSDSVVIIISKKNEDNIKSILGNVPVTFVIIPVRKWSRYINRIIWLFAWLIQNFKLRFWFDKYFRLSTMSIIDKSVDVLLVPTTVLNFYALKVPSVLCIHDIQQEYHPELFNFMERILRWGLYRLSCWKADSIQASSEYIKDCLIEKFKFIKPKKIFIAYEGVDLEKFSISTPSLKPIGIDSLCGNNFVFYPAQLWPHKNHLLLIEALSIFKKRMGYELPCVFTGYDYGHWRQVQQHIEDCKLNQVYYLGRVNFESVLWLYQNCMAVLALGLHESSSLPVREGAVFGKPLICSNILPNLEIDEFLHLNFFNKSNPNELADVFVELTSDSSLISEMGLKNVKMVRMFDWKLISHKYLEVFKFLCKRNKSLMKFRRKYLHGLISFYD